MDSSMSVIATSMGLFLPALGALAVLAVVYGVASWVLGDALPREPKPRSTKHEPTRADSMLDTSGSIVTPWATEHAAEGPRVSFEGWLTAMAAIVLSW
jgi:hypothetical protein